MCRPLNSYSRRLQAEIPGMTNLTNAMNIESVSVSTAFPVGPICANDPTLPDVIILSSDQVFFGVHSRRLLDASKNSFDHRLPEDPEVRRAISGEHVPYVLTLSEHSHVLNVVLHTIYGRSCAHHSPPFHVLSAAVSALKTYAIPLAQYMARDTPLYILILEQAPLPRLSLEAFTLAAENGLDDLAATISPYVLAIKPDDIPDELAQRMGGMYLKRICGLRQHRHNTLRDLVAIPPFPHPPDRHCTPSDRQGVTRAWRLASAQLMWKFRPGTCLSERSLRPLTIWHVDLPAQSVRDVMGSLSDHVSCLACKESLANRVNEVVIQWSLTDVSDLVYPPV